MVISIIQYSKLQNVWTFACVWVPGQLKWLNNTHMVNSLVYTLYKEKGVGKESVKAALLFSFIEVM